MGLQIYSQNDAKRGQFYSTVIQPLDDAYADQILTIYLFK